MYWRFPKKFCPTQILEHFPRFFATKGKRTKVGKSLKATKTICCEIYFIFLWYFENWKHNMSNLFWTNTRKPILMLIFKLLILPQYL